MSTSTVAARRSPSRPRNWRTLLLGGVIVAIVAAVAVLALTSSAKVRSVSPRLVQANPPAAVAAYESDAAHFGNPSSEPSALSSGMGHR